MSIQNPALAARVSQASKVLGVEESVLAKSLADAGVDDTDMGINILDAKTTTEDSLLQDVLGTEGYKDIPTLKKRAAASVLKGEDPFGEHAKKEVPVKESSDNSPGLSRETADAVKDVIHSLKGISTLKDQDLLEMFDKDREPQVEDELNRRAKGQRFIVLKSSSTKEEDIGSEPIDIETSLILLRKSRRIKIPTIIPGPDGTIVPVYKLDDLHMDERIVELCPICGDILFRGYCEKCQVNFSDIALEPRQFIKLVVDSGRLNVKSYTDRKAVVADAIKGIGRLRQVWPSVEPKFRELKMSENLPRLKMVRNLPSEQPADPFFAKK